MCAYWIFEIELPLCFLTCLSDHVTASFRWPVILSFLADQTNSLLGAHIKLFYQLKATLNSHICGCKHWSRCCRILRPIEDVSLTLPCCLTTSSLHLFFFSIFPRFFKNSSVFILFLPISPSPPPHSTCFPQAPFSTVYECRSIHSYSLSGSFAGFAPDPIFPVCLY